LIWFGLQYFSCIIATSVSCGKSRRELPTMGKQLVDFDDNIFHTSIDELVSSELTYQRVYVSTFKSQLVHLLCNLSIFSCRVVFVCIYDESFILINPVAQKKIGQCRLPPIRLRTYNIDFVKDTWQVLNVISRLQKHNKSNHYVCRESNIFLQSHKFN
jgi:hypothetical protein